jgi:hypothetical protein
MLKDDYQLFSQFYDFLFKPVPAAADLSSLSVSMQRALKILQSKKEIEDSATSAEKQFPLWDFPQQLKQVTQCAPKPGQDFEKVLLSTQKHLEDMQNKAATFHFTIKDDKVEEWPLGKIIL